MSVDVIGKVVGAVLILLGTGLCLLSAFGVIRLPDVYTRSHAATKSATLGVLCTLLGTFIYFWLAEGFISVRLVLGIFFVFLTAPVAGHLICRAAYRSGVELTETSVQDDLKKVIAQKDVQQE